MGKRVAPESEANSRGEEGGGGLTAQGQGPGSQLSGCTGQPQRVKQHHPKGGTSGTGAPCFKKNQNTVASE